MKKIVISGGTGNIGKILTNVLIDAGYKVVILSRQSPKSEHENIKYVIWDGASFAEWVEELENADTVINLSGKSIQCRFTEKNKKELLESRVQPTQIIGKAIDKSQKPPRLWINFSGISIFEGIIALSDEESTVYADTFLANLTKQWEHTFFESSTPNTQKVCLRLSPVLSRDFGMFKELYPLAKLGLGGTVSDGKQLISWIHEEDLIRLVLWIIDHASPSPIYHACTSNPESNKLFMKHLREASNVPIGIPLPTILAKIGASFKGVESSMLLLTNAVTTKNTIEQGFEFHFPTTNKAFNQLTKNK